MTLEDYGIIIPPNAKVRNGKLRMPCPNCYNSGRAHPNQPDLTVDLINHWFKCHYCGWGKQFNDESSNDVFQKKIEKNVREMQKQKRTYSKPTIIGEKINKDVLDYFATRGISEQTAKDFKITNAITAVKDKATAEWTKKQCICFNYYKDGELVNIKYRSRNKEFALGKDCQLIPYNIDAIKDTEECIITEGEFDTLAFYESGFKNAISVPNGASDNPNLEYLDDFIKTHFENKKTIYIATDTDTKGKQLRKELQRRFGEKCKIVTFGKDCKDANELLLAHGKDALISAIENARASEVDGEYAIEDDDIDEFFNNGMDSGLKIGYPEFDKLMTFKTKLLYVVTGVPSSGKSEFIDQICERMNYRHNWRFGIFSPENEPFEIHFGKIASKITGRKFESGYIPAEELQELKKKIRQDWHWIVPKEYTVDNILKVGEDLVRRYGIKMLVLDPYNRIEIEGDNERNHIKKLLIRLKKFAVSHDVLVMLMAHPTKPSKDENGYKNAPSLYDISGSADFFNMADFGFVVHRNDTQGYVEVKVSKSRFKHLGAKGTAKFFYSYESGRYSEITDIESRKAEWDTTDHLREKGKERVSRYISEDSNDDFFTKENGNLPF